MKKVVITGARGYIGRALANRLAEDGLGLRLVSRGAETPLLEHRRATDVEWVEADLRDPRAWSPLIADATTVVHLSSRTDLRAAEADPAGDENVNIQPVRALVQAAQSARQAPAVVFASTVTIVGAQHVNPVDEKTPDRPCSVYDRHKLECESILRAATQRGVLQACSLRLPNVYGYGAESINANRGILNVMMRRALGGEALTLFGDGSYVRDFTHLEDVVDAFYRVVLNPSICDGSRYVVATGRGYTLAEAFRLIAEETLARMHRRIEIRHVPEPKDIHPIEQRNFVGNPQLFSTLTGWCPHFDLQTGIQDYFKRALSTQAATAIR